MPACQALNCRNKQGQCKKSFFVIPNPAKDDASKQRCKQWLTNLRNRKLRFENYVFNARKLVCEDHFTPDCFDRNPVAESLNFLPRCKKLKPDAVPTLIDTATNKMKTEGSVKNVRVKLSNNKLKLKKNRAKTKDDLLARRRGIGKPRASATVTMVTKHSHPECNSTNQLEHGREDTSFISQNNPVSTSVTVKEKVECDEMVPCRVCGHPCSVCLKSEYPRPSQFPPDHYGYCRKTRTIGTMTEATDNGIVEHGDIVVTSVKKISHTLHKEVRSNINESHGKRNPVNGTEKHLFDSHEYDASENDGDGDNDEVSSLLQIKKFIVFESCIDDMLNCLTCNICKCPIERSSTIKEYRGSMIMVSVFCPDGHLVKQWSSQPLRGEIPVVELLVSAATPFAGQSYTQISQFANFMNLQIQSEKAYETVQREIVLPVVDHSWNVMQDHIFRKIKDSSCFLSNLDVYHRVLTKYVPKRQDFDLDHMNCRTAIAIIDHNMSQNRDKKVDMHGIGVYKTEFSKVVPNMEAKPVTNSKLYKWVAVLMKLCLLQSQTMAIPIETVTARSKGNIASVQPQKKADIVSKLRSRFKVVYDQMP
uniref:THAP-type domain-containing protein n=1 Tax=Magallana gigas TaxID=29159 RepID=A0A8W8LIB8_MAGGI